MSSIQMSKYARLGGFLRSQRTNLVPMTFADIERVTGVKLPPSAQQHRPWWSNNPNNSVMTKVWLDAGFRTEQVDMAGRKLVFRRVEQEPGGFKEEGAVLPPRAPQGARHPMLGALKGLVRIMLGTDLTQPADPEWGKER